MESETARCWEPDSAFPPCSRPPLGAIPIPTDSFVLLPILYLLPTEPDSGPCHQPPRWFNPSPPLLGRCLHPFLLSGLPSPPRLLSLRTAIRAASPHPTASQPVPSHRCSHVRLSIRPSFLGPALTMPSGCRCLHLMCLLCILGAPVQHAVGERNPDTGRGPLLTSPLAH